MNKPLPASSGPSVSRRGFLGSFSLGLAALVAARTRGRAETSAPARKFGVALVGLGNYSTGQLGPALRATKFCRLAGVVTGSPAKGAQWARDYGFPEKNIYGYDTMAQLRDNPDIDIVYVVTPNALHAEHAIAAARAGKHVICEKPFTTTVADAERVLAEFRAAKIRHSIGYRLHFDPSHEELRKLVRSGDFGAFTKMNGGFSFTMGTKVWRAEKKLAGGGPIMDLGIYVIQEACAAAGEVAPVAVTAHEGPKTRPEMFVDVEETMNWTMEFPGGLVCEAETSYSRNRNGFRAEGARGWIEINPAFSYRDLHVESSRGLMPHDPQFNQQAAQLDDFAQCVLTGRPSRVPGEMGLRDMKIVEAIYRSAATGRRVELGA
jgi:glucose-fructose oxidoreductase